MSKWFIRSKTLWLNGIAAGGLLFAAQDAAANDVEALGAALVAPIGNTLLRFVTSQAIGRFGKRLLKSKTVVFNILLLGGAGLALAQGLSELGIAIGGLALVNLWLRLVTKSSVTVLPHPRRARHA